MEDFAEVQFQLNARDAEGFSKRDHLLSVYRQTGVLPEELANAPELPEAITYLWDYFLELHQCRVNFGFGPARLQFTDIEAWARLTKRELDPWELNAILELDRLFMASIPKPKAN